MEYKDYYKTLGVEKNSTQEQIQSAYRKLARKFHPDLNPGNKRAEEKFKGINEAYEVLHDPAKRAKYDQLGNNWQDTFREAQYRQNQGGFNYETSGSGNFSDFFKTLFGDMMGGSSEDDIFGDMTSGRRGPRFSSNTRQSQMQSSEYPLEITLEDAYFGAEKMLTLKMQEQRGVKTKNIQVKIPKGINDGTKLRIDGQKSDLHTDLILKIKIQDHHVFRREGADLHCNAEVSLTTAMLGGDFQVRTMKGNATVKIKPETQNGTVMRMKGIGMPNMKGAYGDQFVHVKVRLPVNLSKQEKELFEKLKNLRKGV